MRELGASGTLGAASIGAIGVIDGSQHGSVLSCRCFEIDDRQRVAVLKPISLARMHSVPRIEGSLGKWLTMSRIVSFVLAAGFIGVFIVVVLWGVEREGRSLAGLHPPPPETPQIGEIILASRPAGDETALRPCVVCHSVNANDASRAAPDLYGIVGASKAASPWYNYSKALRSASGVWTEADLDKYLTHPPSFLPGTKKTIVGIADADARREIIEALKATSRN